MPKITLQDLCLAMLPARVLLDLLWWCSPLGISLGAACSALFAAILSVALLSTRLRGGPLTRAEGLFASLFGALWLIAALRADSPLDALRYGIQVAFPALWVAAMRQGDARWPAAWTVSAAIPVAISLVLLIAGQPAEHVLHGWPRLVGAYGNLHGHAAAMAVFCATLGPLASLERSRLLGAVAIGAAICLAATWVRGAWLWALLAVWLWLVVSGRLGRAALLVCVCGLSIAGIGLLRDRWSDVLALATGNAPEGGWGSLGSWRVRIWTDSFSRFSQGSAADLWLGRGFGGHLGLHRHLDPHSDWLSVLYQVGIAGLLLWTIGNGALLVALFRRRREPLAALALCVLSAALLVALLSNDLLFRPTPLWWTYALAGCALGRAQRG